MSEDRYPPAVAAPTAPARHGSNYPEPYKSLVSTREKRPLGDLFGLANFGVNLTRLPPGAPSALRHSHSRQDELIYILEGEPTLILDRGEIMLGPGMCAGFKSGSGEAHHLVNRTDRDVVYLEIGDRSAGDEVSYPDDDLMVTTSADGKRRATHKDGRPY
jgi:uncharacterized cupin superfamily protein